MQGLFLKISFQPDETQTGSGLTGVEEEEELHTGDLSAVDLQCPQPLRQLLTPLDQRGQSGLSLGQDGRQLHLQTQVGGYFPRRLCK